MSRFVEIGNVLVNTDAIINVYKGRDGYITYILKDGKREVIENAIADYDIIKGESVIV